MAPPPSGSRPYVSKQEFRRCSQTNWRNRMEAAESPSPSTNRKLVISAAVLVVVFLAGYIPGWIDVRGARSERDRLDVRLRLVMLCNRLGMVSYETNRNNYASAMEHSSGVFQRPAGGDYPVLRRHTSGEAAGR